MSISSMADRAAHRVVPPETHKPVVVQPSQPPRGDLGLRKGASLDAPTTPSTVKGATAPATANAATAYPDTSSQDGSRTMTQAMAVIMRYIPTEILTLYVPVLAALKTSGEGVLATEYVAFFCFLAATPLVVWLLTAARLRANGQVDRIWNPTYLPVWEMVAASIAFVAWAAALPNHPFEPYGINNAMAGIFVPITAAVLGLLSPIFGPLKQPPPDAGATVEGADYATTSAGAASARAATAGTAKGGERSQ